MGKYWIDQGGKYWVWENIRVIKVGNIELENIGVTRVGNIVVRKYWGDQGGKYWVTQVGNIGVTGAGKYCGGKILG